MLCALASLHDPGRLSCASPDLRVVSPNLPCPWPFLRSTALLRPFRPRLQRQAFERGISEKKINVGGQQTHLFLLPLGILDLGLVVVDDGEQVCQVQTGISTSAEVGAKRKRGHGPEGSSSLPFFFLPPEDCCGPEADEDCAPSSSGSSPSSTCPYCWPCIRLMSILPQATSCGIGPTCIKRAFSSAEMTGFLLISLVCDSF